MSARETTLTEIKKACFVFTGEGVKFGGVLFPMNERGRKRLEALIGDGRYGLMYRAGDKEKTIIAVDLFVPSGRYGVCNVRVLGDPRKVPQIGGVQKFDVWLSNLPAPLRAFEIGVVDHNNEKLFAVQGTLFDSLNCEYGYIDGSLTVLRKGEVFDRTREIREYGTHGACPCFMGLAKVFGDQNHYGDAVSGLDPENFEVGDVLLLEFPVPLEQDLDFGKAIRASGSMLSAFTHAFDNKNSLTTPELQERLVAGVQANRQEFFTTEVVRFKASKK